MFTIKKSILIARLSELLQILSEISRHTIYNTLFILANWNIYPSISLKINYHIYVKTAESANVPPYESIC